MNEHVMWCWRLAKFVFSMLYRMAPELLMVTDRPMSNLDIDAGYIETSFQSNYPYNVYSSNENAKLQFLLRSLKMDVEFVCRTLVPGYKLYLHSPFETIRTHDTSIRVPFAEEVSVSIMPKLTFTAETLLSTTPDERKCFFHSERELRFFKFYSSINCEAECLANYTLLTCDCVKFSMPSKFMICHTFPCNDTHSTHSICGIFRGE